MLIIVYLSFKDEVWTFTRDQINICPYRREQPSCFKTYVMK